ncbi:hypothetical protein AVEN_71049-1, partial [Araneus ventricosus]
MRWRVVLIDRRAPKRIATDSETLCGFAHAPCGVIFIKIGGEVKNGRGDEMRSYDSLPDTPFRCKSSESDSVQKGYNDAFIPIVQVLPGVAYKGKSTHLLSRLNLSDMLPENPASFYRYIGSLTTPPCDEGVIWSILRKTAHIGRHQ